MKVTIALLTLALTSSPASSFNVADAHRPSSGTRITGCSSSSNTALSLSGTSTETGSTSSSSSSSPSSSSSTSTCVPPPNSRLAQWRQSQSLPGTKNRQNGRLQRPSKQELRYASYPQDDGVVGSSAALYNNNAAGCAPLFYHLNEDDESESESVSGEGVDFQSTLNRTNYDDEKRIEDSQPQSQPRQRRRVQIQAKQRQRARMLRPFPKRLSLYRQRKFQHSSSQPTNNNNNINNNKTTNKSRQLTEEYQQRKAAWAAKYTSVSSLRTTFGTNKNKLFGDYDPVTTRKLYHTLLPRALLELRGLRDMMLGSSSSGGGAGDTVNDGGGNDEGGNRKRGDSSTSSTTASTNNSKNNNIKDDHLIQQELKELAPLAYQARVAAKKYARERSRLPGRIGSMLYDGYRQWRRYGKWDNSGMSWDQVWEKYEDQVLGEVMEEMMLASSTSPDDDGDNSSLSNDELATSSTATLLQNYGNDFDDEELTARICLRILERSVATNEMVDKLFRSAEFDEEIHSSSSSSSTPSSSMEENTPLKQRRRRRERQQQRRDRILKDLKAIEEKFDEDIQELLRYSKFTTEEGEKRRQKRKKGAFFWKKSILSSASSNDGEVVDDNGVSQVAASVTESTRGGGMETAGNTSNESAETNKNDVAAALFAVPNTATTSTPPPKKARRFRKLAKHEIIALRILATTKQRIAALQATKED